jgi:FAD/FMN-containing dehydrogenase
MSAQNPERRPGEEIASCHPLRRTFLKGGLATFAGLALQAPSALIARAQTPPPFVNDITLLNPVRVARIAEPRTTDEIRRLVNAWPGPISIGGGRYSMGGQIAAEDSLHLDMRNFNQLVSLDPEHKTVRVQTGMRWRDLQNIIDPHDLSVKIMQSYANFTIGGALSVNAHGRYVALGPLINSVRRIQLVLPGGLQTEVSPTDDSELFYGAIGGYGGVGIITEVELDLAPNVRMERHIQRMPVSQYSAFFNKEVRDHPDAIFHNADLEPPDLDDATALTWLRTDKPVTLPERMLPAGKSYALEALEVWALAELPGAHLLRRNFVDPIQFASQAVVWRNHEASIDVASLGPIAGEGSTYALQEYFIPVAELEEFARKMSRILRAYRVNALNVSLRQSPADPGSILAWAREEVFSFVLYYRQSTSAEAQREVGIWTRQLIDASLSSRGTYYLPYQLHATQVQFDRGYPAASRFFALKARVDPRNQLRNKLWDKYRPIR